MEDWNDGNNSKGIMGKWNIGMMGKSSISPDLLLAASIVESWISNLVGSMPYALCLFLLAFDLLREVRDGLCRHGEIFCR